MEANQQHHLHQAAVTAGAVPHPANRGALGRVAATSTTDPTLVNPHRHRGEGATIVRAGSNQGGKTIGEEGAKDGMQQGGQAAVADQEEGWIEEGWTEEETEEEGLIGEASIVEEEEEEVVGQAEEEEGEEERAEAEVTSMEIVTLALVVDTLSKELSNGTRRIHEGREPLARGVQGVQRGANGSHAEMSGIGKGVVRAPLLHLRGGDTINPHRHPEARWIEAWNHHM